MSDPTPRPEDQQATVGLHNASPLNEGKTAGQRMGGYLLLGEIGRGGMGVVFKAHEADLNRIVALKMVLPQVVGDAEDLQRFHGEASAAARLTHPNIVKVHRVGVHEGRPFYSMDYIEGKSLAQRLDTGPLPGKVAARYVMAIARAIHHAHEQGILHRDLKPANILIDAADVPHVTDFGLAKQLRGDTGQTATGAILGTPGSMSPEQAAGKKDLTPACDIYGLGALLYELITARPPFRGETAVDTVLQVLEHEPVPPRFLNPRIDKDLETICLKCLRKAPEQRYASACDLADDLERYLSDETITARSVNMLDYVSRSLQRSQYDAEFGAYSNVLFWFAAIVFLIHVIKQVALLREDSVPVVATVQVTQFLLMAIVLWRARPQGLLPTSVAERQMWAVWLGYLLGCGLVSIVTGVMRGKEGLYRSEDYPYYSILAGMAFFVLGSSYWGRCYLFGLTFFGLALVLLFDLRWGTGAFGTLWAVILVMIALRLRWLARENEKMSPQKEKG